MATKYLIHHGILGQKWGDQNGPPYPLDYNDHSAAEKKLNPKSKIDGVSGSGNGSMSQKDITRTLGFDLSKYTFQSVFTNDGVNRNVQRQFQTFGFSVKKLIDDRGEAGAIEYLQKEWGFSKEDAESAVKNLDKVWQDHTAKGKDAKEETKKSSGKSSGGSQKAAKAQQAKEEKPQQREEKPVDETDNPYTTEVLTKIDSSYKEFKEEYDTLSQGEKDLFLTEWEITDAEGYAQYATKNMLKEEYNMSDEVAEAMVEVYVETISEAEASTENIKMAKALIAKIADASNTIEGLRNLKYKKERVMHTDIYLAHHGIEGQKWGVRRYQNPDGTLTPEGRERYGYEDDGRGQQQTGEKKSFVQRHKKALIVGGAIVGAIAISKGVKYFQNRQGDRIDEIVKAYEKSWNKHALSNRITTWKNGEDWNDVLARHNAAMANKINSLYAMKYSDLANEARRVSRVLKHSEGDNDE